MSNSNQIIQFLALSTLLFIWCFSSYGQVIPENTYKNGNGVLVISGEPLFGFRYDIRDTLKQKQLVRIATFKNGKKNGVEIQFWNYPYDTASIFHFVNNEAHGNYVKHYMDPEIHESGLYLKDFKIKSEYHDAKGNLLTNTIFTKDTIRNLYYVQDTLCNSHYKTYFLDDHLSVNLEEYMRTYNGEVSITGAVKQDIYFTKGRCDSIIRYSYGLNGKHMLVKNDYANFERTVIVYYGYNCVRTMKTFKIVKDKIYGKITTIYDKYLLHGAYKEFYYNGILKSVRRYENDVLNGESLYYNEAGELYKSEFYRDGLLVDK